MNRRWKAGGPTARVPGPFRGRGPAGIVAEGEDSSPTEAVLFRAGGMTLLDYRDKPAGFLDGAIHPHGLFRVDIQTDHIELAMLEGEQLDKMKAANVLDIEFADLEPGVLLTAKSHLLQSFVLRHAAEPSFFGAPIRLRRLPAQ